MNRALETFLIFLISALLKGLMTDALEGERALAILFLVQTSTATGRGLCLSAGLFVFPSGLKVHTVH